MNKKIFNKKLVLSKQTIVNLVSSEMQEIEGGTQQTDTTNTIGQTQTQTYCLPCSNTFCGWTACYTCILPICP